MTKILFDTRVNKFSTCLSYVLDRTGKSGAYKFITEIDEDKFDKFNASYVKVGDIVAWKNKTPKSLYDTSIITVDDYPVTVANMEDTSYHLGVVERIVGTDYILISDATRSMNNHYLTEIRLSLYNKYNNDKNESKLPEFILNI